ncbi:hypothetical protein P3X46_031632 [Hevea brasiliensis]|uniref:Ty3 transposon capsid-like protein domain-containing protein n=1 Tax=Hevea brasiliensis TaxID=3981 RepID=A0ABQ9KMG1_HEVBR|nr:hypothetical protein P3X46_031632 [Hevea brasiliensis]
MTTNKECIENLESGLGGLQNDFTRIERAGNVSQSHSEGGRQLFFSKFAKLEFPRFSGGDPTEWFAKVDQSLNTKTPWNHKKYHWPLFILKEKLIKLWARFGPTDCEDFDKALSKIKQMGSLCEYQQKFERLGNRVHGWSQKALIGTFIGGLKPEVAEGIRMFKPKTLK